MRLIYHSVKFLPPAFNSLSQIFSAVDQLALEHEAYSRSSEEHNEVDRTEWRKLFWPFRNMKTFSIDNGLVDELSCCLQSEDGKLTLDRKSVV